MLNATPPTISQPADVLLAWRVILMLTVSEWSAESIKTVLKMLPVSTTNVPTHVFMKTPVPLQPPAQFKTTMPNVSVLQDGWATHLSHADQRKHQLCQKQTQNVSQMETVQMTLPVSMKGVRTHVMPYHHVM